MAVDERSRHELYVKLQEVLGPEPATTFMEMSPPVGMSVATTQDVAAVSQDFQAVKQDVQAIKHDVEAVKHDVQAVRREMAAMNVDLHKDMELLRFELLAAFRGEINTALTSQMKSIVFANTSLFVAFAGLVWSLRVF